MADNPQEQLEKKILLTLETSLKGMRESIDAMNKMEKLSKSSEAQLKKLGKGFDSTSKSLLAISKSSKKFTSSITASRKAMKSTFESARAFGKLTRNSFRTAGIATAGLAGMIKHLGDTMLEFRLTSFGANSALDSLRQSYTGLSKDAGTAMVSVQDLALTLTKFQSQGIAETAIAARGEFKKGFEGILGDMTEIMGKGAASDTVQQFYKSFGNNITVLRDAMQSSLTPLVLRLDTAQGEKDTGKAVVLINQIIDSLRNLRVRTGDQGLALQRVIATYQTQLETISGGGDALTRSTIAWRRQMAALGTTIENFGTQFIGLFGDEIGKVIDFVVEKINKGLGGNIKSVEQAAEAMHKRFMAWGGVDRILKFLEKAFDGISKALSFAITQVKEFVTWFQEANIVVKGLTVAAAGMIISPNFRTGVIQGTMALWQMHSIMRMNQASAAMMGKEVYYVPEWCSPAYIHPSWNVTAIKKGDVAKL